MYMLAARSDGATNVPTWKSRPRSLVSVRPKEPAVSKVSIFSRVLAEVYAYKNKVNSLNYNEISTYFSLDGFSLHTCSTNTERDKVPRSGLNKLIAMQDCKKAEGHCENGCSCNRWGILVEVVVV